MLIVYLFKFFICAIINFIMQIVLHTFFKKVIYVLLKEVLTQIQEHCERELEA